MVVKLLFRRQTSSRNDLSKAKISNFNAVEVPSVILARNEVKLFRGRLTRLLFIGEKVLRFEISMNHSIAMYILQTSENNICYVSSISGRTMCLSNGCG